MTEINDNDLEILNEIEEFKNEVEIKEEINYMKLKKAELIEHVIAQYPNKKPSYFSTMTKKQLIDLLTNPQTIADEINEEVTQISHEMNAEMLFNLNMLFANITSESVKPFGVNVSQYPIKLNEHKQMLLLSYNNLLKQRPEIVEFLNPGTTIILLNIAIFTSSISNDIREKKEDTREP